jgi:hypothetical protein
VAVTRRALLVLAAVSAGAALVGCGGDDESAGTTDTVTTTELAETTDLRVYWLRDGKVWPAAREVEETEAVAEAALSELLAGPTADEVTDLAMDTAVPDDWQFADIGVEGGVAAVEVEGPSELPRPSLGQIVYTLTQFDTVESVEIGDTSYTRADFEDLTPAILVESPLAFEEVDNPVRATGTANTFEANFHYELTDTDGRIVDENFVTATSGSGERGTFDFTTAEYEIPFDGMGALIVFERSAEDGSRINLVEIPVRMSR